MKSLQFIVLLVCFSVLVTGLLFADVITNTPITPVYVGFVAEFDVTVSADTSGGVVALTEGPASSWGDMSAIIQVYGSDDLGYFRARNGSAYGVNGDTVDVVTGNAHHVKMVGDVVTQMYDVFIDGQQIADDFMLRTGVDAQVLNNLVVREQRPTLTVENIVVGLDSNMNGKTLKNFQAPDQITGAFVAEWDMWPSHDECNVAIGLCEDANTANWGDFSAYLRVMGGGYIDARDGGGFAVGNTDTVWYNGGDSLHVQIQGSTYKDMYSAWVNGVLVADNFGFRKTGVSYLDHLGLFGTTRERDNTLGKWVVVRNFKLGQDTVNYDKTVVINNPIDPHYVGFIAEWDMLPNADGCNVNVGLWEGENTAWSAFGPYVNVGDGFVQARNGGGFEVPGDTVFYNGGDTLHVKMVGDAVTEIYDCWVNNVQIADSFAFRTSLQVIDHLNLRGTNRPENNTLGKWVDIENFVIGLDSLMPRTSVDNIPLPQAVGGNFTVEWDMWPSHDSCNVAVGLCDGENLDWGSFSAYVRVPQGPFDARNGGSFAICCGDSLNYQAGDSLHVKIKGSVKDGLYDAWINNVKIADDFGFRRTGVSELDTLALRGTTRIDNNTLGKWVVVRNIAVTDSVNVDAAYNPVAFALHQNYPNPFNPTTMISYSIPEQTVVKLKVYNMLGQLVKTLVNEKQPMGVHEVEWNGQDQFGNAVSTGVYIYEIEAGKHIKSYKMLMMK